MKSYKLVTKNKIFFLDNLKNPLKEKKDLSIVIPTYNEEGNINDLVNSIKKHLEKTEIIKSYEIIIVDDNSKDKTPEIIDSLSKSPNIAALHRYKTKGIFTAVLDGIKIANSHHVLTMDADFSHPPEIIPEMLKYREDYDIISGSRFIKGGGTEAPFSRKWGSFFLNKICASILGVKMSDMGGNFRLFKKSSFSKIPLNYNSKFAEFGLELFYRAKKLNLKTKEIPFIYKFRKKGKSKIGNLPVSLAFFYLKRAYELRSENN